LAIVLEDIGMYLGNSVASIKLAIKSEEFGKTNIAKDFRNSHSDSGSSSYSKKSRKCTVIRTDLLPADILSMLTEATSIDNAIKSPHEADKVRQLEDEEFLKEKQRQDPIVATSVDNVIKSTHEADKVRQLEDEEFLKEKQRQDPIVATSVDNVIKSTHEADKVRPLEDENDEDKKWPEKVLEKKQKKVKGEKRKKAEEKKQKEMDKLSGERKRNTRSNFEAPGFSKRLCPNGNVLSARPELSDLED
jgi:hypothetical protein